MEAGCQGTNLVAKVLDLSVISPKSQTHPWEERKKKGLEIEFNHPIVHELINL